MLYHLSIKLGRPASELARTLSAQDLTYYHAYHSLYPFDGTREDVRHALLCQLTCKAMGGADSDLQDWIPSWHDIEEREMERQLKTQIAFAAQAQVSAAQAPTYSHANNDRLGELDSQCGSPTA